MASNEKRLEGVKVTENLQRLLVKAVELSTTLIAAKEDNAVTLQEFMSLKNESFIPIDVIRAMDSILSSNTNGNLDDWKALQSALRSTQLVFTVPPPGLVQADSDDGGRQYSSLEQSEWTPEERKFRQRMQRLRFKNEETKYAKLTSNLKMNAVQDDVTTKSMTYAASIGLNMIVAPISFGVFMYFFAGSLLDFIWPKPAVDMARALQHTPPDIKKVIIGVVSGVAMLIIEMLLFVIRTHEMDKAMRKKSKKSKQSPFGHYSSASAKSYQDHED